MPKVTEMKKQRRKRTESKRPNKSKPGRTSALGRHGPIRFEPLETRLALSVSPIPIPTPSIDTPFFPETVETNTPSSTDCDIADHVNKKISHHDQPDGETAFADKFGDSIDGFISYEANSCDPHTELVILSKGTPDNLDGLYDKIFDGDTDQFDSTLTSNFDPILNNRLIDSVIEQSEILHEMTTFSDQNIQLSAPVFSEYDSDAFYHISFFTDELGTTINHIYPGESGEFESSINDRTWADIFSSTDQIDWNNDLSIYNEGPFISFGESDNFKPLPNLTGHIEIYWTDTAKLDSLQNSGDTFDRFQNIPAQHGNQIPIEAINLILRQATPSALTIDTEQINPPANSTNTAIPFAYEQLSFRLPVQSDNEKQDPIDNLPEDQQFNSSSKIDSDEPTSVEESDFVTGSSEPFSRSNIKNESDELDPDFNTEASLEITSELESMAATNSWTMPISNMNETEEGGFIDIVFVNSEISNETNATSENELTPPKDIAIDAAYDRGYAFELAMGEEFLADQLNVVEASRSLPVSSTYSIPDANYSEKKNDRPSSESQSDNESDNESDNDLSQNDQPYWSEAFSTIIIASAAGQIWQDQRKNRFPIT
jgi:hypothetical protein